MKLFYLLLQFCFSISVNAQIPKSGTYVFNYCDEEYHKCINKCKVKIVGNKVWVYAPSDLTGIKEGEVYGSGIITKHKSGKWFMKSSAKEKSPKIIGGCGEGPTWIDFKRKRFWTC